MKILDNIFSELLPDKSYPKSKLRYLRVSQDGLEKDVCIDLWTLKGNDSKWTLLQTNAMLFQQNILRIATPKRKFEVM